MRGPHWTDQLTPAQWRQCRRCTPALHRTLPFEPPVRLMVRTTHQLSPDRSGEIAAKRLQVCEYGPGSDAIYHYEPRRDWGNDAPASSRWSGPVPRLDLHQPVGDQLPPLPPKYEPDPEELARYQRELERAATNLAFEQYCAQRDAQRAAQQAAWEEAERHHASWQDSDWKWSNNPEWGAGDRGDDDEPVP